MNIEREFVQQEAALWVTRMRQATPEERARFTQWMLSSDEHLEAFVLARISDHQIRERLKSKPLELEPLLEKCRSQLLREAAQLPKPTSNVPARRWQRAGLATAAAVLVAVSIVVVVMRYQDSDRLTTGAGEWQSKFLPDGSFVRAGPQTDLVIEYRKNLRTIRLARGEAMFKVAHNAARPFIVDGGLATARAVGTAFAVSRENAGEIAVTVEEGTVAVARTSTGASDSAEVLVHAGEQIDVTPEKAFAPYRVNSNAALAWVDGHLDFESDTLASAVKKYNRFSSKQIVIADPSIASLPIRGIFFASDPDSFIVYLKEQGRVRVVTSTPTTTLLYDPDSGSTSSGNRTEH